MAGAFPPDDDDYTGKGNLDRSESGMTEEQKIALRELFATAERPTPDEIIRLANEIRLKVDDVNNWFSNMRVYTYMRRPFEWHRSGGSRNSTPLEDPQRPTSTDRPISPVSQRCPVLIAMLQSDPLIIRPPGCFGGLFDSNTSEASAGACGDEVPSTSTPQFYLTDTRDESPNSLFYQPEARDDSPNSLFYQPEARDDSPNSQFYQPEARDEDSSNSPLYQPETLRELTITIQLDSCSIQRDRENDMIPHSSTSPSGSTYPHTSDTDFSSTQHPQDCVCSSSHSPTIAINTSPTKRARYSASGGCSQPNFPSTSEELPRRASKQSSSVEEEDNSEVSSTRHSPDNPEDDTNEEAEDDDEDTVERDQQY